MLLKNNMLAFEEIKNRLMESSINKPHEKSWLKRNIDWAEKVVVFNISKVDITLKENHRSFEILKSINIKCKSIDDGLTKVLKHLTIGNIDLEGIDTIVIKISIELRQF
jgi:hypothetical protein